ncbi:GMC oxidoreductase [Flavobacterium hydrophilum]|uniref:Cholesterol oxidase n=1 Tax=Flavobacterium hydrophilum TaxID=2211445 RepID=A0A2V4C545_9FLAO|nr:GMC oxidoreductase [Flavobacterium hydrophilum]PXY46466.1 GMC family oxidoreductase [Flavobacterium hydrophilum]
MKRLSKPITSIKSHYPFIIIGSGYGGSIAASRLSRAGIQVCLLEKGKEFRPGEYPEDLDDAVKEMQVNTDNKHIGNKTGLYEFYMGKEMSVFKGCALGGTSNVNANVSIEPEPRVFEDLRWPAAIRNDMQSLKEGYQKAKQMLKPSPYPENTPGYPELAKTKGMKASAAAMKEEFRYLDLNVNFEYNGELNHVGVEQKKCNNCGDCVTGCNHSAKNMLTLNYLPDAVNYGAEIFCETGVQYIERKDNKWLVYFDSYHVGREKFDAPPLCITSDNVILSAGSLGSTEILLRSREKGLTVSPAIGKHFTGNGDVLGFGYNNDVKMNGIGLGKYHADKDKEPVGPCITSIIDMRKRDILDDGMTLEEGSIPGPISPILTNAFTSLSKFFVNHADENWQDWVAEQKREATSIFKGPYFGSLNHTQVYLVMTHDDGNGSMQLENNRLEINWPDVGKQKIFQKVNSKLQEATKALGGTYMPNPQWNKLTNYDMVTVHPLGGCIMGDNPATSVTNHCGQVYSNTNNTDLHQGLYVMDGSIIPRPLGTNPLLTISALAERNSKIIVEANQKTMDYEFKKITISPLKEYEVGVSFTETMRGFISLNEKEDFKKGYDEGEKNNSPFDFTLTIQSQDIEAFTADSDHKAGMIGTVNCPALSKHPITVTNGIFNLFVKDENNVKTKLMKYAMQLRTYEGRSYSFYGFKDIRDDKGFDLWADTTTLYITVYEDDNKNNTIGKGILKIAIGDFMKQLQTMKAIYPDNNKECINAVTKFGKLFAGEVWETFF